ncbi:hypothetical protein D5086_024235 [Populus alba]|uniref:Uncharacterized protein n=1 Tax=Populus alba TaxID=43335 RepID=A0ACC4B6F3_POPAL
MSFSKSSRENGYSCTHFFRFHRHTPGSTFSLLGSEDGRYEHENLELKHCIDEVISKKSVDQKFNYSESDNSKGTAYNMVVSRAPWSPGGDSGPSQTNGNNEPMDRRISLFSVGKGRKEFRLTKYREHVNRISIHYPSVIRSSRPINWMRPHSQFLSYRTHRMNKDRGRDGMILSA